MTLANILVIDDDESMRLGCQESLSLDGHRVCVAPDGVGGLARARDEAFDVVVLDLRMPGPGGMEVLERLREESPNTQVVVITGYATIESAVEAMRRGAYDYLAKPFSAEMLTATVTRALERRQLALENLALRMALKDRLGGARWSATPPRCWRSDA